MDSFFFGQENETDLDMDSFPGFKKIRHPVGVRLGNNKDNHYEVVLPDTPDQTPGLFEKLRLESEQRKKTR